MTDNGKPSGIATTTTVTPIMKKPINVVQSLSGLQDSFESVPLSIPNLIHRITIMKIAEYNPKYPISLAMCSSFYYKGVHSGSTWFKLALILPMQELSPTTKMQNLPAPVKTLVPDKRIGEETS